MNRRTAQGANWGLFLLLSLALFSLVNYLSFRHYRRWDWTASGTYSLSDQTRKVLADLKSPVDAVVFLSPGDELYERVKALLGAYAEAGRGQLRVEYIDPDRQKDRLELLAKRYQVTQVNVVVFSAGEQSRYVEKDQMVEYDLAGYQYGQMPKVKSFKAEEAFTNALLAVVDPARPTVYFTAGHGERAASGERGAGLSLFRDRLGRAGATLKEFNALGKEALPADASLVVVAGPKYPFSEVEAALLSRYLEGGGRLLLLLDPVVSGGAEPAFGPTGLEALCARWGITPVDDIALDPALAVPLMGAQTFYAADLSLHPATRDLSRNGLPVIFALARSLSLGKAQVEGYASGYLARTSPEGWGERDIKGLEKGVVREETDTPGPLTLAAVAFSEQPDQRARLAVVGDSDFTTDSLAQSAAGNLLLATNLVNWLLGQESRLAVPPKTAVETHLTLTAAQANFLFVLLTLLLPAAVVGLGVYVYLRRRR